VCEKEDDFNNEHELIKIQLFDPITFISPPENA
jgi:hypothetical protein